MKNKSPAEWIVCKECSFMGLPWGREGGSLTAKGKHDTIPYRVFDSINIKAQMEYDN
ncbi:MAG: hypothetical protein SOX46_10240 [Clostridiaceae bacterium]|uniref:hypothetical protein n=1 Tax=Clostridium sp. TaxID=1506 RepID=UPI002586EEC2|nr:hypothetical protein [Clostridium sp.]MDY3231938.1 hypothetical protein [Clostridiaceae bacterium]